MGVTRTRELQPHKLPSTGTIVRGRDFDVTTEGIFILFGCLLLFIGIIGGGLEIKEIKVPQVSWPTRLAAIVAGFVFVLFGIGLTELNVNKNDRVVKGQEEAAVGEESSNGPIAPVENGEVKFTVVNELGLDQISESLQI